MKKSRLSNRRYIFANFLFDGRKEKNFTMEISLWVVYKCECTDFTTRDNREFSVLLKSILDQPVGETRF